MSLLFLTAVYAAASLTAVFVVIVGKISACSLYGLHAYLLPGEQPPEEQAKQAKKKSKEKFVWNEDGSEILRVTIGDSYIESARYYQEYDQAVLYSALATSVLLAAGLLQCSSSSSSSSDKSGFVPLIVTLLCVLKLVHIMAKVSWDRNSSRNTEWALSLAVGFLGFVLASVFLLALPSWLVDFGLDIGLDTGVDTSSVLQSSVVRLSVAVGAGWLTGSFLAPVLKSVRSFWVGTNQLAWETSVLRTGLWTKLLLHLGMVLPLLTALLWCKPMAGLFIRGPSSTDVMLVKPVYQGEDWAKDFGLAETTFEEVKFTAVLVAGLLQLLLLRTNVQSYLNLGVLAWYESLHGSKAPDAKVLKNKILVINYFLCRVAVQCLVPGMLVLLLAGLSRASVVHQAAARLLLVHPGFIKQLLLFFSWWAVFSWSLLSSVVLSMFRLSLLLAY